jgi:ABC-2 type transport system permease protein
MNPFARLWAWISNSLLWPMVRKEFIQLRRDPGTLGMILGIPAMQLLLFGFAVRTDVRHLATVVLDQSQTPESRMLVETLVQTQNFDMVGHVTDRTQVERAIGGGSARAAVIIPPDFARALKRGETASAQVVVDASNPLSSSAAIGAAGMVLTALPAKLAGGNLKVEIPIDMRVRPWYNPGGESSTYIVPGLVAVMLTMTFLVVMAGAIVREREVGTLEQLIVTPISKTALLLGKVVPFILIAYLQMTNVLVLGRLVFHVPVRGSLLLLYGMSGLFILALLGLGLMIATFAKSQASAQQMSMGFIMPSILLSGFLFPREAMPLFAQRLGTILPITYYLEIVRGILLKGSTFDLLWKQALFLGCFAVVTLSVAVRRFAKTVE